MTKPTKWHVCPAKTQISLGILPLWSEASLSAWRKLGSLATHWAHGEDWSDWADAQADLSLRWAHMPFCWLCHEAAEVWSYSTCGYLSIRNLRKTCHVAMHHIKVIVIVKHLCSKAYHWRDTACITLGNVVRGNQNYANEILTGASGHELQSVDRMSTNLLPRYLQISKRENRQFGNVVPNSFYFYTILITILQGKTSCQLLIWFLVYLCHYTLLGMT